MTKPKSKTSHDYELELKRMIKLRTGDECEPWLAPQIRATANNQVILDRVQQELEDCARLSMLTNGSMQQKKNEVNPLLDKYNSLQKTLLDQFEALGLNYKTPLSKINRKSDDNADDSGDPMMEHYRKYKRNR